MPMQKDWKETLDVALSDRAIDWLVRLNSGEASTEEEAAFAIWRAQSDAHESAATEAEAIWFGVGLVEEQEFDRDRANAQKRLTRRAALGAGFLLLAGAFAMQSDWIGQDLLADHVTGIGERRRVQLADGSSVDLNAGTALSVDLGSTERHVTLLRGQATFEVAQDAGRPFIVTANGGQTRAIGTAFDIDMRRDVVYVTVLEGVIAIAHGVNRAVRSVTASANQMVHYSRTEPPTRPKEVDSGALTAWRRGKMIFDRRPLDEVVADIQRQRKGRIIIANDRLAKLVVTGVFDLDDPETVLNTMETGLSVRVARLPFITVLY